VTFMGDRRGVGRCFVGEMKKKIKVQNPVIDQNLILKWILCLLDRASS